MVLLRRFRRLSSFPNPSKPPLIIPSRSFTTPPQRHASHTPLPTRPVIGILGAGISGLSAAYYITKMYGDKVQTVLFEESDRFGGWVNTVKGEKGGMFEMGPRTVRPFGVRGLNTLDLVEDVGLDNEVLYGERSHDVAKNRFIYVNGELVKLPSDYTALYRKMKPFSRPLFWALLKDLVARRESLPDDSIHNFVTRRFGQEIGDYLMDPLIRGICSGDSKRISVKFLMKNLFELEQKHRSVILGTLREKLQKKNKCSLSDEEKEIGYSKVAASSLLGNWAVWGLERGIGSLPERIYERARLDGVQVKFGCRVESLKRNKITYSFRGNKDFIEVDHVISTVGSNVLGRILSKSDIGSAVVDELNAIEYQDLQVTGIKYSGDVLDQGGFGFLVPSVEKSVGGLLGVVFDTNCFPQGNDTVLTVMSRGVNVEESIDTVLGYVRTTLGVNEKPVEVFSRVLRSCIPQYGVGHYERVGKILAGLGSISVCGNWVGGVSVNDCVYEGKSVARGVGDRVFNYERVKMSAAG